MTADEARALLLVYTPEEVWRDHAPSHLLHLWSRCGTPRLTADQVLRAAVSGTRGLGYRRMAHLAVEAAWGSLKYQSSTSIVSTDVTFAQYVANGAPLCHGYTQDDIRRIAPVLRQQSLTYGDVKDVLKAVERLYDANSSHLAAYFNRVLDAWLTESLPGKNP